MSPLRGLMLHSCLGSRARELALYFGSMVSSLMSTRTVRSWGTLGFPVILACFVACAAGASPDAADDSFDPGGAGTGASSGTAGTGATAGTASGVVMNPPSSYPQN